MEGKIWIAGHVYENDGNHARRAIRFALPGKRKVVDTCAVLMSTYNGEKYLEQQIDSILAQTEVDLLLIVRDDDSKDKTPSILKRYEGDSRFQWYSGGKLGCGKSFMDLITHAPEADYYAFADQDDVWYPSKLNRAIHWLKQGNSTIPLLYCGNQNCVDANGNHLFQRLCAEDQKLLCLESVIFHNVFSGCTMVFNRHLHQRIVQLPTDNEIVERRMHDVFIVLAAEVCGKIVFDPQPMMDFRRHGGNLTDERIVRHLSAYEKYANKVVNLFRTNRSGVVRQSAQALLVLFEKDLTPEAEERLRALADYQKGWKEKLVLMRHWDLLKHCGDHRLIAYLKVLIGRL